MAEGLTLDLTITRGGAPFLALARHIPPAEVLCVMGPSGAGKSTLLAAITGTLAPGFAVAGRVALNGRDLTGLPVQARRIGLMFQDALLFPHLSVAQNLAFGLAPGGTRAQRRARVAAALAEIGMQGFGPRDPATLSGGQATRVALMRTLLSEPQALLLDEPFSALDAGLRAQIRDLTFAHARARGLPVLLVTHDAADAQAAGGPVVMLDGGSAEA